MTGTDTQRPTDDYSDIEIITLDEDEVRVAIANALAEAECTWEELQAQAAAGEFRDHIARETWFVVATLDPDTP